MQTNKNETPPTLVVKRLIHAKREKVFEAWTNPQMMQQWFFAGKGRADVTNSLTVGGSYSTTMYLAESDACTAESKEPQGYKHSGKYLEIFPPEKLVFTWSSHLVTDSRVTIELREAGDSTELKLTHELLDTAELRTMHSGGWEACISNLENYVAN